MALLGAAAFALSGPPWAARPESAPLFVPAEPPARAGLERPHVIRQRPVRIDRRALGETVTMNLFPGVSLRARHQRTETPRPGSQVWVGRLAGEEGRVFLSTVDGVTVGSIRTKDRVYAIRYAGDGVNLIEEVDTSGMRDGCDDGGTLPPLAPSTEPAARVAADPCGVIDLMVLYTPAARDEYGGPAGIKALIHLAVSATNVSFEDSGVTTRVTPVHIDEILYQAAASSFPGGNVFHDRDFMIDPIDGVLDGIHPLRERYCADIVMLITRVGGNSWCGAAKIMDPAPDPAHHAKAFAVSVAGCAVDNLTFPHELGHIFGARHDWYMDDNPTPYTHAHGYLNVAQGWRTMMSYEDHCKAFNKGCPRLGVWSNPAVLIDGVPAGVASGTSTSCTKANKFNPNCDAENWRTINATDCAVANFRERAACIASGARNVWMKDTWDDTGLEPDPWTSGQDMWKSPYIWARNAPDTTGAFQHLHQNPEFGQTNYVYTKLHNDFDVAATGRLKMYYAAAATGLSWPQHWTEFANSEVTVAAHATLLRPSTWSPPGAGHYCLLARWDSPTSPSDPMTFPEGSSIAANTRGNNNIVWRNVNVVNLEPDLTLPAPPAIVRNLSRTSSTSVDLALELPDDDDSFLRKGGSIRLDLGGLLDNWQSTGARGDGARLVVDPVHGTVAEILDTPSGVATLRNIPMSPLEEEAVRLILTPPYVPPPPPFPSNHDEPPEEPPPPTGADTDFIPRRPVDTFGLDLVQLEGTERIGGVGYEIHVTPSGGSGSVPDGGAVPGVPLTVSRSGGQLALDWSESCSASDLDYAVYEGALGDFDTHLPIRCSTAGATSALVAEPTGDAYYLVVASDGRTDGSYGLDSAGRERIGSESGCRPHAVLACP